MEKRQLMGAPVISCDGVTKSYGGAAVVSGVSLDLEPGEILGILGASGSGKTTLLRLIAGFEDPDEGVVEIQGKTVSSGDHSVPPEKRGVSMVFQEFALFPHMTVAQNVTLGLHRSPAPEQQSRLAEVIDLVKLRGLEHRYPHELSGGQQQRVALARAIAPQPIAALLDEPFSNLDAGMRREMRRETAAILRRSGAAAIFVTHDREEAFAISHRIGVMSEGRLVQIGAPAELYDSPATPLVAKMSGTSDFIRGVIRDGAAVTDIGRLPYRSPEGRLPDGASVSLLAHPGDFRLRPSDRGEAVALMSEFLGDFTITFVETPSGDTIRCRHSERNAPPPGARVQLVPEAGHQFWAFTG